MPIEIDYNTELDCMVIKVSGTVAYADLIPMAGALLEHEHFRTNINQLFDCTEGMVELAMEELKLVAKDFMSIADTLGHSRKLALVVTREVDYGRMRQYEVFFGGGPGVQISTFRSLRSYW